MKNWQNEYKNLDLSDGKILFISDDDEDMIEIRYKDGMLIDVGYISRLDSYFITVVSNDTAEDWEKPLEEIKVENKTELFDKIQETVYKYRRNDYLKFATEQFDNMWKKVFFHDFKKSRKKYGLIGAIGIIFLLCVIRGLGNKFIWQGTFWEGFLDEFVFYLVVFIILTVLYFLVKKIPKVGGFVVYVLLILSIVFLLGIVLLIIVLLLNYFLHFWF